MASLGWGKDHSVGDWLYEEPYGFDFFQAVRLLELAAPGSSPVGEGAEPAREAVRFRSGVGLDFPASDVAEVRRPETEGAAARMTVNFMGLAGATGPLNMPSTELIIERAWHGDEAPRDFLDIFNHRLVSLLYRTRKLHRVALDNAAPGLDRAASYLYSVAGLGTASLRGRMQVKDRALLFYAGLLGQQPRSMAGLEALLSHYFGVRAVGLPFKGRWQALEESQWTRIGESGQNMRLGVDAVAGTRVWDEEGAFEIELGPLTREQFEDFLPTGWAFRPLCDLVRFYVGDELDFSFRLRLAAREVPDARLPKRGGGAQEGGVRLGWSAWLDPPETEEDSQVVVSPASLKAFEGAFNVPYFGLPPDKLQELVRRMTPRTFEAGRLVCRQGDAGDTMYVVRRGSVKVVRRGEDGVERHLATLGAGHYFGELALISSKFRRASVVTLEECELLELSKKDFHDFADKYPRFKAALEAYSDARTRKDGK
ncbi:MAG TPA: type VI secretion system baseplate subunit TssG [Pyrinomonadaceae bacterium]|nr:type VI secretion system baseplate subunit TssG [Pyrinomonadaceae bacterium]